MKTQTQRRLSRTKETLRTMGRQPMKPNTKLLFREIKNRYGWKDHSREQTCRGLSKTKGKLRIIGRQHILQPNTKTIFREPKEHYEPNRQPMKPITKRISRKTMGRHQCSSDLHRRPLPNDQANTHHAEELEKHENDKSIAVRIATEELDGKIA